MAMQHKVVIALALILLFSLAATRTVDGQVPTAVDFAACNEEAPQAVKAGTASPIMGDRIRADRRHEDELHRPQGQSRRVVRSANPRYGGGRREGRHVSGRISQLHETEGVLSGASPSSPGGSMTKAYRGVVGRADHSITRSARSRSDWGSSFLLSGQHPGKWT